MREYLWILAVLSSLVLVGAEVSLVEDSGSPEMFPCQEFKVIQKTFNARSENINIGLVCPESSRIELYSCAGECSYSAEGYKNNGKLAFFSGFEVGSKYQYKCYTCAGSCALEVNEKETVDLTKFFQGVEFRMETPRAGLNEEGKWLTKKGDAGFYNIVVETKDGSQWEEIQFCLEVKEVNEPAQLILEKEFFVKEGQTLSLNAQCTDPEGEEVTLTYSGWMEEGEKKVSYSDAGKHSVVVSCFDSSGLGITKEVKVVVANTNRAPIIEDIWEE